MSQYGEEYIRPVQGSHIYYDNQSELAARSDFTHNPQHYSSTKVPQLSPDSLLNTSHSTIQTQFLNLEES